MVLTHANRRKEAFHEPDPLIPSFSPNGGEGARRAVEGESVGFMVPMHGTKVVGAFHEPPVWSPGFSRSGPPEGGTPYRWHDPDGFMVPMHGTKVVGAIHEPPFRPRRPHRPCPRLRG